MDYLGITRLFVRITGLIVLVIAVSNIPHAIGASVSLGLKDAPFWVHIVGPWLSVLVLAALAWLLLTFPSVLVNRVVVEDGSALVTSTPLFQELAFVTLGAYFIVDSLSSAAYEFGRTKLFELSFKDTSMQLPALPPDVLGGYAAAGIQFVCGLVLFFGARAIIRLWARLRGRGSDNAL